jgi:hypothetical protein
MSVWKIVSGKKRWRRPDPLRRRWSGRSAVLGKRARARANRVLAGKPRFCGGIVAADVRRRTPALQPLLVRLVTSAVTSQISPGDLSG